MRRDPLGRPFLLVGQLVHRNVLPTHLAIGGVFLLVRPLHPRGQVKPVVGVQIALGHTLAHGVEHPKRPLRTRIPRLCSLAIPIRRQRHIPRNAPAIAIKPRQPHLSRRKPLLRRPAVPSRGGLVALSQLLCTGPAGIRRRARAIAHLYLRRSVATIGLDLQCRLRALCHSRRNSSDKHQCHHKRLPVHTHMVLGSLAKRLILPF